MTMIRIVALVLIALIAALHAYIAWFEIFAWVDVGPTVFASIPAEQFAQTESMAINQGTYNAFLAVGLLWTLTIRDRAWQRRVGSVFLGFVVVAGCVAAATVDLRPGVIQAAPAALALLLLNLSRA